MKKIVLVMLCLGIILTLPNLAVADCVELGGFTNFLLTGGIGGNTVALYAGSTPVGQFDVTYRSVEPESRILLLNSMSCDRNDGMINGSRCTVMNVTSSN